MDKPEQLRTFLDDSLLTAVSRIGDGLLILESSRVVYVNDTFCKICGFTAEELFSLPSFLDLVPSCERHLIQSALASLAPGKNKSIRCETPVVAKADKTVPLEMTLYSVSEGHEAKTLIIARMVSESKASSGTAASKAASLHRGNEGLLKSVVQNAPIILFSIDRNGLFTLSEGNGLKVLNLKPGELVGQSAFDFYRENPNIINNLRRALSGEEFIEIVVEKERVFETHYLPIQDEKGEVAGIVGTAVDVTEPMGMEAALYRRVEFEKLISSLSSHFINLPPEKVAANIQIALQTIGQFVGADRILIYLHQQGSIFGPEFSWHAGGTPERVEREELPLSNCPWFKEKIGKAEVISVSSPEDLPPQAAEEKKRLLERGIVSFVAAPMIYSGNLTGLLMLSTQHAVRQWTDDDLALFKIAGEMFASALEHRKSEEILRGNEEKFRELFNNAIDAIFLHEISNDGIPGKFLEVNDIACTRLGYPREEFLRMTPFDITLPEDLNDLSRSYKRLIQQGHLTIEKAFLSKNGARIPVEVNSHLFVWNNKKVVQSIARDITDRKRAEETIRRQAYYDVLTNLPNRTLFKDRLEQAMKHAHRNQQRLGVVVLDLDRFKNINETLGHILGDKLLVAVAERLLGVLSESETIARFGGDEFTLLLPQVASVEEAAQHAQKIIELLATPFKLNSHELHITTSIGMAFFPDDGESSEILMKNAETAMYRAKEQGRNNCQLYASVMNASAFKQLLMENSLQRALDREEFVMYYQPQIDIKTRQMVGCEALVRWMHPDLGLVYPSEFIGLAEETGLIVPIGEWILRKVCQEIKKWHDEGYPKVCVSVNLSARQFQQKNLVPTIARILQETGLDPQYLGLEITESIAMKNADFTVSALTEMKKMGIHLSLDDFGTGYSSLSYLKRFPLETLKIDRSFVRDITTDPNDAAIVTAVVALAHSLKLKVIAEGVETEGQLMFLKTNQCDYVQGYFYSHPLAEENFLATLKEYFR